MYELKRFERGQTTNDKVQVGGECSTSNCLTIYVAPWCPHCTAARPMLVKLTEELRSEGITVDLIVGRDEPSTVRSYARKYPFPVLLDANGKYFEAAGLSGVPYFMSGNSKGEIIQAFSGYDKSVRNMRLGLVL